MGNVRGQDIKVISLGGSLVSPDTGICIEFLRSFRDVIVQWLKGSSFRKIIIVVGGGAPARRYQVAAKQVSADISDDLLDWLGIAATHLNAELVRTLFKGWVFYPVVENPNKATFKKGKVLIAGGWKPGFSTDYDAVILAKRFGAKCVINLSNVAGIYTSDPYKNPKAISKKTMSWLELQEVVGNEWEPGLHSPFDPIATLMAASEKLMLIVALGSDFKNLSSILYEDKFEGTVVS